MKCIEFDWRFLRFTYTTNAQWHKKLIRVGLPALNKWWFSVLDVVVAINDQSDYKKNRNYWKYLI